MDISIPPKVRKEFIGSLSDKNKADFWGDFREMGIDLLEIKRNGLFRYDMFEKMNYFPHEAQKRFHDNFPHIEEVCRKEGLDPDCPHIECTYRIDPKDPSKTTRVCVVCKAEFRNMYHNRFRVVIAAARWGKSLAVGKEGCLPLVWPGMNADGSLNREKAPRAYIYAPSYSIGRHEFNYLIQGMEEMGMVPERYNNSPQTGNMYARYPWGAEVTVKSWDNPKSILGDEIDLALFAEASTLPMLIFERYIRARMGSRLAYGILGSTPHGIGEFLETFYEKGRSPKDIEVWAESFSIMSNPYHPIEDVEEARAMLDARTFAEQYLGKFVTMAGLVFETFDKDVHIKKQITSPKDLPRGSQVVFGIDFGRTAPTGCLMTYWDKDGALHVLGEYYVKGKTIKTHFHEYLRDWLLEWMPSWIVYDYQQVEAAQFLQDEIFALQQAGVVDLDALKMIPCKKGKKAGIERVRQLLHVQPETGFTKFYCDPSCDNLHFEFLHYANKKTPDGRIIDVPEEKNDHLMDCVEYICATSYEDAELRRDRLGMLDMEDEYAEIKKKPLKIHQEFVKDLKRKAEESSEEEEDDFTFDDDEDEENDYPTERTMDYDEW